MSQHPPGRKPRPQSRRPPERPPETPRSDRLRHKTTAPWSPARLSGGAPSPVQGDGPIEEGENGPPVTDPYGFEMDAVDEARGQDGIDADEEADEFVEDLYSALMASQDSQEEGFYPEVVDQEAEASLGGPAEVDAEYPLPHGLPDPLFPVEPGGVTGQDEEEELPAAEEVEEEDEEMPAAEEEEELSEAASEYEEEAGREDGEGSEGEWSQLEQGLGLPPLGSPDCEENMEENMALMQQLLGGVDEGTKP